MANWSVPVNVLAKKDSTVTNPETILQKRAIDQWTERPKLAPNENDFFTICSSSISGTSSSSDIGSNACSTSRALGSVR